MCRNCRMNINDKMSRGRRKVWHRGTPQSVSFSPCFTSLSRKKEKKSDSLKTRRSAFKIASTTFFFFNMINSLLLMKLFSSSWRLKKNKVLVAPSWICLDCLKDKISNHHRRRISSQFLNNVLSPPRPPPHPEVNTLQYRSYLPNLLIFRLIMSVPTRGFHEI